MTLRSGCKFELTCSKSGDFEQRESGDFAQRETVSPDQELGKDSG